MPSLKRNVSDAPATTGFESYDGPNPPLQNKMYRGEIQMARVREASTGTLGFNLLIHLKAEKGSDDAQYDGYPAWVDIWLSDKEPNLAREAAFYRAVGVPDEKLKANDVNVVHDDLDEGGAIKKVGGKKVVGALVKVDMKTDRYGDELRLKGDAVFPIKKSASAGQDEDPDADLLDDTDGDAELPDPEERQEELDEMGLPALKKLAKEYGIETARVKKPALIEAILEAEYGDEDEPEEGEPEDEPDETGDDEAAELYDTVKELSLPKLRKWARENGEYTAGDLKDLDKDDILEMLVDDEVLSEPPF